MPADVMNGCVADYWVGLKQKNFTLRDFIDELSRRPDIKVSVEEGDAPNTYIVRASRYDSLKRDQVEVSWEFRPGATTWNRTPCDTGEFLIVSRAWEQEGDIGSPGTASIDDIVENSAIAKAAQAEENQRDSNASKASGSDELPTGNTNNSAAQGNTGNQSG